MCELNLAELSNEEVRSSILKLRNFERECEVDLLFHLIELEKRDLHLAWGYSTIYNYLVNSLGYSEASASRRVRVSKLFAKYPEIARMLRSGNTNLSCISLIASVLEKDIEKGRKLLAEITGKTCREVETLALDFRPETPKPKEFIKVIKVAVTPKAKQVETENTTNLFCNLQDSSKVEEVLAESPETEIRYEVRCSLSHETKTKLSKAQNLMVHKLKGDLVLENVFNELIDCYLAKHAKDKKVRKISRVGGNSNQESKGSKKREAIPAQVKREVYSRDNFCCSYQSEDGIKCGKESNLELDHVVPVAHGGENTVQNLRVVCREHNQFLAREVFGREFMEGKVRGVKV